MLNAFLQSICSLSFFQSVGFGILGMVLVGSSWCLIGLVMGDAPKRGIDPALVQFFGAVIACLLSIGLMVSTGAIPATPWKFTFLFGGAYLAGGVLNFCMLQQLSHAMQLGPNGIIWCIAQSSMLFSFLGNTVFFHEPIPLLKLLGILLLFVALVQFGFTRDNRTGEKQKGSRWKWEALLCMLIASVQQNLTTLPSHYEIGQSIPSACKNLFTQGGTLLAATVYILVRMNRGRWSAILHNMHNRRFWLYIVSLQFFSLLFSYIFFYPGMDILAQRGMGGLCYPIMIGSCILSFTLSGIYILREKVQLLQILALVTCLGGLVLISIGSMRAGNTGRKATGPAEQGPTQRVLQDKQT